MSDRYCLSCGARTENDELRFCVMCGAELPPVQSSNPTGGQATPSPNPQPVYGYVSPQPGLAHESPITGMQDHVCPECGAPVMDDWAFCIVCGATIKPQEPSASAMGPAPAEEPAPHHDERSKEEAPAPFAGDVAAQDEYGWIGRDSFQEQKSSWGSAMDADVFPAYGVAHVNDPQHGGDTSYGLGEDAPSNLGGDVSSDLVSDTAFDFVGDPSFNFDASPSFDLEDVGRYDQRPAAEASGFAAASTAPTLEPEPGNGSIADGWAQPLSQDQGESDQQCPEENVPQQAMRRPSEAAVEQPMGDSAVFQQRQPRQREAVNRPAGRHAKPVIRIDIRDEELPQGQEVRVPVDRLRPARPVSNRLEDTSEPRAHDADARPNAQVPLDTTSPEIPFVETAAPVPAESEVPIPVASQDEGVADATSRGDSKSESEQTYTLTRRATGETYLLSLPVTVGKGSAATVRVAGNRGISRVHARLYLDQGRVMIEDLGSTNHTYVQDRMLTQGVATELKSGDVVRLANESFDFAVS